MSSNRAQKSSSSRLFQASQSILPTASSSRPFLNMLNPMGRTYQGYVRADEFTLEEEEGENRGSSEEDLEAGRRGQRHNAHNQTSKSDSKTKTDGKRHVSWRTGTSEMNVLHPNIHREDKVYENESSDDEVPQSFMIEASSSKPSKTVGNTAGLYSSPHSSPRQALNSTPKRNLSSLPAVSGTSNPPASPLPRRSELVVHVNREPASQPYRSSPTDTSDHNRQPKQMRGLDPYERALWNWVNVYNLDAFLQEVYYYYEGKGIYSIALARGLNLLLVTFHRMICHQGC